MPPSLVRFLAGLLLAAGLISGAGAAAEYPAPPPTEEVWLPSDLRDMYPSDADICLSTYQQMADGPGVVLALQNQLADFSHYRYTLRRDSLPPEAPVRNRTGAIAVRFDAHSLQPQRITVVVRAVARSGRMSRPFAIELGFYPTEFYAASGHRSPSWLVVHYSDLALCGGSVEEWIVDQPTAADRAYVRKRWGRLVAPLGSDYERAKAIARDLAKSLRRHEGIPSSQMEHAPGLVQLARAEGGQDRVWCGNYADIFSAVCNALDIPVRKIDMQYVWSTRNKVNFEIGEAHRTTEVFDRKLHRWVWIGLTLGFWGAYLDERGPLDMAELVHALHDPQHLGRLRLVEYDDATGVERLVSVAQSQHGRELFRFYREDQRYKYVRRSTAQR